MITHFLGLFCRIRPVTGGPAVRFRTTIQEECALSKTDTSTAMGYPFEKLNRLLSQLVEGYAQPPSNPADRN